MILYYTSDTLRAKLTMKPGFNLENVDRLMARDGMKRVTKKEYQEWKEKKPMEEKENA